MPDLLTDLVPKTPEVSLQQPHVPGSRRFEDAAATRAAIFDRTLAAAQQIPPVENTQHRLSLIDVAYEGPESFSLAAQKKATLGGGSLTRRLRGTWVLQDLAGTELGRNRATIARVPYLTDRGVFILNGNAQTMGHQLRLRPGVYARRKSNGELEAHVNVAKGLGHRVFLDPQSGIFRLQIGQARLPLVALLRAQGVTPQALRDAWGTELADINLGKNDSSAIPKLYKRLFPNGTAGDADQSTEVARAFAELVTDPDVNRRTLGHGYTGMTSDAVLATTKKLLQISRGEAEEDDRDAMVYQTALGPEDIFAERMSRAGRGLRQLLWRASPTGDVKKIPAAALDGGVRDALAASGLGQILQEINPAEVLDQRTKITRMGQGGITSSEAIPEESRSVQPTQLGFIDSLRTPESSLVGVDLRLASSARKGPGGEIYMPLRDRRTGEVAYKSPREVADLVIGFADDYAKRSPDDFVATIHRGRLSQRPLREVDVQIPDYEETFSALGQFVPMKSTDKGQRAVMASRMITQALPLRDPEAPYVQSGMRGQPSRSYEEEYASQFGAVRADQAGRVTAVTPDGIDVTYADGTRKQIELFNNYPFNQKTAYHQTARVQPGDVFQPGQLLASSNYTDAAGVTALGKNARVGYIPWQGLNFEDAVVISDSFAKRLSSEHLYQNTHEWSPEHHRGRKAFVSLFPSAYDRKTLAKLDDSGVVKPGEIVQSGDPLVLIARERERNKKSLLRGRSSYLDESITWDHHAPGVVTDVFSDDKGVNVVVKSYNPTQVGDKLSGRHGDKGVVAAIIPDSQMPHDEHEQPLEILLNPAGLITRTNAAQALEAALGKVAAKTGKPYKWVDFDSEDTAAAVAEELKRVGLKDEETVTDPNTGRRIPDVLVGNRWFMKLHHTAEAKMQGRGLGSYTADRTPAKGGPEGAKRVGMLETLALLSHGATDILRETKLVRGQANPQYWSQYQAGASPATPTVPYVYQQFVANLTAAGINPVRRGTQTHLMALTNADIDERAGARELKNADTVNWKTLEPIKGGLFDPQLTGGHATMEGGGDRWAKITLHEPMPSPVMEEPIRRVLGLTWPKFEAIIAGKEQFKGRTGPAAIGSALGEINLPQAIAEARLDIQNGRAGRRDAAVRRLGYLKSAERLGIHPREWMLDKVPVLPPMFRPISQLGPDKLPLVADPNLLYREVWDANQSLKQLADKVSPDQLGEERLSLYNAFKAVTGLGAPTHPKNEERKVRGVLGHVFGPGSPKYGAVQRKLLGSTVDLVGRGTIVPDPDLDMDQVGVPESQAWAIYKPAVVRRLVRGGMPHMRAVEAIEAKNPSARKALQAEIDDGVVLINRAPTLHKYGFMAARPVLVTGDVLRIPPVVVGGFGADFDGDAMQIHALTSQTEKDEATERMLPSKNLRAAKDFGVQYTPSQEYVGGLYEASTRRSERPPAVFHTAADAMRAYRRGEIDLGQRVQILTK